MCGQAFHNLGDDQRAGAIDEGAVRQKSEVAEVGHQVHRVVGTPLHHPCSHVGVAADVQPLVAQMGSEEEEALPAVPGWVMTQEQLCA